jgi:hypothetical protein
LIYAHHGDRFAPLPELLAEIFFHFSDEESRARRNAAFSRPSSSSQSASSAFSFFSIASISARSAAARRVCSCSAFSRAVCGLA